MLCYREKEGVIRLKEIPVSFVRANQWMMVLLTLSAILFQSLVIVGITFVVVTIALIFGPKANLAFLLVKTINNKDRSNEETEAAELQRFNQTIAASLLFIGFIILLFGHWLGWIFIAMVTIAASVALAGFCVGCFFYFQLKKLKYQLKK